MVQSYSIQGTIKHNTPECQGMGGGKPAYLCPAIWAVPIEATLTSIKLGW